MRKHIDLFATLALALILGVLAASAWLADRSTRQLVQNEHWVMHTYDVLVRLDRLLTTVLDVETGERGYLLTGEGRFLQPYQQATSRIGEMLRTLALDTADNSTQQDRLRMLTSAVDKHLQLLAVTLANESGSNRGRRPDLLASGKRSMDEIREQVAAMRQAELSLLSERLQRSRDSFSMTRLVFLGTALVTMALVVLTHTMLRRDIMGRRRANARLGAANAHLRDGLRAAAKVQASLLPPVAVQRDGAKFAWAFQPCEELAGDALNICPLADGRIALYLLDVSGHGAAAALSAVAVVQALTPTPDGSRLALGVETPVRPEEVLATLNDHFSWDDELGQFFTICFGVVDPLRKELHYSSAGHPPPILVRHGQPPIFLETPAGFPIGLDGDFGVSSVPLRPGDRVYFYSDGVTEAIRQGELFGGRRLLDVCDRCRDRQLQKAIDGILSELRDWRGSSRARDDVSLLAVEMA